MVVRMMHSRQVWQQAAGMHLVEQAASNPGMVHNHPLPPLTCSVSCTAAPRTSALELEKAAPTKSITASSAKPSPPDLPDMPTTGSSADSSCSLRVRRARNSLGRCALGSACASAQYVAPTAQRRMCCLDLSSSLGQGRVTQTIG